MTSSSRLIRRLAPSEAFFATVSVYVSCSTHVSGPLDMVALSRAFDALRAEYPVLSCRIVSDGAGQAVLETVPVVSAGVSQKRASSDDPLDQLSDLRGSAAAVHVVRRDRETSSVTLLTHHAIADGPHSLRLLATLWSYYTDTIAGRRSQAPVRPYPRCLEDLLSERGIVAPTDGVAAQKSTPAGDQASDPPEPEPEPEEVVWTRTRLTMQETESLLALGRQENTTLNGVVSAALLRAAADALGVAVADLTYEYAVDLRRRLVPPVDTTDGTNVQGTARFVAEVVTGGEDLALARAISARLTRDLATGAIQRSWLCVADRLASLIASPKTLVQSANWGTLPPLSAPEGLTIEDFHPALYLITEAMTVQVKIPRHSFITTFDGRLTIDSTGPLSYVQRVDSRIREYLSKCSAAESQR
ncbi:hypothetical protein [Nocardia sp. XZ_19_385]|uniref:phthiocerol/phthiodiolone dimycocerosyl transferase family protein n=1 Tax=Nocardia sp. XZ_19_385 TaxID=2769488 RepID=UPI00189092B9|nr:hypothetical protein [Nocardia sp. XZ_19_385]